MLQTFCCVQMGQTFLALATSFGKAGVALREPRDIKAFNVLVITEPQKAGAGKDCSRSLSSKPPAQAGSP